MTTKRRFFYHYNKPYSQKMGETYWSVHFKDVCYFVKGIDCRVPTQSKNQKIQPRAIMIGFANKVELQNSIAIIS